MSKKNKSAGLDSHCFEMLSRDILDGIYAPGEKLSMIKMKKALSAGQSPIREALSCLLSKGLVQQEKNKGFRVICISEKDIRDLFATIIKIDTIALQQSIEFGDDQWEVNLVAIFHHLTLNENCKNWFVVSKGIYSFQRALILGCNSPSLINVHDNLFFKLEFYTNIAIKNDFNIVKNSLERKKQLLDAVLKRDGEKSCALFKESLTIASEEVIYSLKKSKHFN